MCLTLLVCRDIHVIIMYHHLGETKLILYLITNGWVGQDKRVKLLISVQMLIVLSREVKK